MACASSSGLEGSQRIFVRRCWQLASLDEDAVNGAAKEMPCAIPNILVDYVRDEPPGLTTGWWRGVGPTQHLRGRELHRHCPQIQAVAPGRLEPLVRNFGSGDLGTL
jgi:hypothetical protein